MSVNGKTVSLTSQCQIIWYKWKEEFVDSNLPYDQVVQRSAAASGFDLSNHLVEGCSFSKTLSSPSGTFSFKLDASQDWREEIRPGQWCLIYMSNAGELKLPDTREADGLPKAPSDLTPFKKNLRGICHIERVAVTTAVDEKGALDVVYEISGRDFGMIYEETSLWFSYFLFEQAVVSSVFGSLKTSQILGINALLELGHKLFFSPDQVLPAENLKQNSITSITQQWLLPVSMVLALGIDTAGKPSFFGNIVNLNFKATEVTKFLENPFDIVNGAAWAKLKALAISPELHELFPETSDDGVMQLTFRPIPFSIDQSAYKKIAKVITPFVDLKSTAVDVTSELLITANLGRDEHSRYNHFLLQVLYSYLTLESNISILKNQTGLSGKKFPYGNTPSIVRYGFKPMHSEVHSFPAAISGRDAANPKGGATDGQLLLEYNELLLDYWGNAVNLDSGTVSILGQRDVKIGKAMYFDKALENIGDKLFYIEGYTDDFTIDSNGTCSWTQTIQLTRGATMKQLRDKLSAESLQSPTKITGDYTGK